MEEARREVGEVHSHRLLVLGVGKAACAEEITQQSVLLEEPAYGRYERR